MHGTDTLKDFLPGWERHLRAAGKSPRTIVIYLEAATALVAFLGGRTLPGDVTHRAVERYLAHLAERPSRNDPTKRLSPAYVNQHYRSLFQLFRWLSKPGGLNHAPGQPLDDFGLEL